MASWIFAAAWTSLIPAMAGMSGAGLAGFFHNKPDFDDEAWSCFCDKVANGDVWLDDTGFYSSSGYGDGCYGVFANKKNGEITALEIRFL